MNNKATEYVKAAVVFICFIMIIIGFIIAIIIEVRNSGGETSIIETEATVVEKKEDTNRIYNGKMFITTYSYYLYVQIDDIEEEQEVRVPESYYEGIYENDTVMVDVTVDENNEIVSVDLSE